MSDHEDRSDCWCNPTVGWPGHPLGLVHRPSGLAPKPTCWVQEDSVAGDIGGPCRRDLDHDGPHDPFAQSAPPSADKPWRTATKETDPS